MPWPKRQRSKPPFKPTTFEPMPVTWWKAELNDSWPEKYKRAQGEVRRLFAALEDVQFDPLSTTNVADMIVPGAARELREHLIKLISSSYKELAEYRRPSGGRTNRGQVWKWHCPYYWAAPVEQQCEDL